MEETKAVGQVGQWISVSLSIAGFLTLLRHGFPTGRELIVLGAIVLALATKVRYYGPGIIAKVRRKVLVFRNKRLRHREEKAQ